MEYYLSNLISAKSFIRNINASSLSMDDNEFVNNMRSAKSAIKGTEKNTSVPRSFEGVIPPAIRRGKAINSEGDNYPFMDKAEDWTATDVPKLLGLCKQVVTRYFMLSRALIQQHLTEDQLLLPFQTKPSNSSLRSSQSENTKGPAM
ncbi:uncharacterized protein A4U43_C10F11980 [Asparagus officinalis]|uniref:VPS9 domain-containing protein n=1 Tax=Asparagus officinalis TaxID=4686 RepID=A0A5P1E5I4_ASPOF|nr:uncharacterized protein A4U43_C10F11980 [Asparagus officinalis]